MCMSHVPVNMGFRWTLTENTEERWLHLARPLMDVRLTEKRMLLFES
jgi:hypothetical protein